MLGRLGGLRRLLWRLDWRRATCLRVEPRTSIRWSLCSTSKEGRGMRPEHWLYTIPLRLRSLFRRAQADQELGDELRENLERKTEEYVAQGMTQEEAHRRARLELGGIEQTKEKCRDARKVNW